MSILINTFYVVITWIAAFTIGFGSWLGWLLLLMAALQSWAVLYTAVKKSRTA